MAKFSKFYLKGENLDIFFSGPRFSYPNSHLELGFNRDFYKLLAEKEHKPICIFSYSPCLVAGDGIFAVKGFLGIMINKH